MEIGFKSNAESLLKLIMAKPSFPEIVLHKPWLFKDFSPKILKSVVRK
nr:MAG TPA: hypothetical protein [Caudoviricetes sp.]